PQFRPYASREEGVEGAVGPKRLLQLSFIERRVFLAIDRAEEAQPKPLGRNWEPRQPNCQSSRAQLERSPVNTQGLPSLFDLDLQRMHGFGPVHPAHLTVLW